MVTKTSTLVETSSDFLKRRPDAPANEIDKFEIFSPIFFPIPSTIKVACEPMNPSELPKMIEVREGPNKP